MNWPHTRVNSSPLTRRRQRRTLISNGAKAAGECDDPKADCSAGTPDRISDDIPGGVAGCIRGGNGASGKRGAIVGNEGEWAKMGNNYE